MIQRIVLAYLTFSYGVFGAAALKKADLPTISLAFGAAAGVFFSSRYFLPEDWSRLESGASKRLAATLLLVLLPLAHVFLLPPYARDDMIYHLNAVKRIAVTGGLVFDPYNINANFPQAFEMPLVIFEQWGQRLSPFLLNFTALLLLCVLYYRLARRRGGVGQGMALAAVAAMATTPLVYDQLRSCYVELFLTLLLLCAFSNYLRYLENRRRVEYWHLTMLFIGFACGTKYLGLFYAFFIAGVEFFSARSRKHYYFGLLLCALVASPWYLKNWIWYGNPLYPFLNFIFHSEFVSVERTLMFNRLLTDYNLGRSPVDYLLLPFRLVLGIDEQGQPGRLGFGGKLSLFYLLCFAAFFNRERKYLAVKGLLLTYGLFWMFTSQQVRFLLPVLVLASLPGLKTLGSGISRLGKPALAVLVVILVQNFANIGATMKREKITDLLGGKVTEEEFLGTHLPISYTLAKELGGKLDASTDRLFTVGNFGRNYYFDVPVITNTYYETEIFDLAFQKDRVDPQILFDFVAREEITHILFNRSYVREQHRGSKQVDTRRLQEFLDGQRTILVRGGVLVMEGLQERGQAPAP